MNCQIAFTKAVPALTHDQLNFDHSALYHQEKAHANKPVILALSHALREAKKSTQCIDGNHSLPKALTQKNHDPLSLSRLYLQVVEILKDEALGALQAPIVPGTFELLTRMMISAHTLDAALDRAKDFIRVLDRGLELKIIRHQARVELCLDLQGPDHPNKLFFAEMVLASLHSLCGWLIGTPIPLERVKLAFKSPAKTSTSALFKTRVDFESDSNSIFFPDNYLANTISRGDADISQMIKSAPLGILRRGQPKSNYSTRVKNAISRHLPHIYSQAEIAGELGLTEQTLRRRLQMEGESYRGIKETLLRELAMRYLAVRDLTIAEIAERLGYSETSALARAFKNWTGISPALYRSQSQ